MKNNYAEIMSTQRDEELIKITSTNQMDYKPEAIEAAKKELESRQVDPSRLQSIKEEVVKSYEKEQNIQSNLVSGWLRIVHLIIDFVGYVMVFILLGFVANLFLSAGYSSILLQLISVVVLSLAFFGYYFCMEYFLQKTVGKFLTKTKVVSNGGNRPSPNEIFIRTISRLIPLDPFSYFFTRNGLHDRFSNTKVIKDRIRNSKPKMN